MTNPNKDKPLLNKGFNLKGVKSDIRKKARKKLKVTLTHGQISKVWNKYVEEKIIQPVLRGQRVKIAKGIFLEVVGRPDIESKRFFNLKLNGLQRTKNGLIKGANNLNKKRNGETYKITYTDENLKFNVLFEAHPQFSKKVSERLVNTSQLFKFINVNK